MLGQGAGGAVGGEACKTVREAMRQAQCGRGNTRDDASLPVIHMGGEDIPLPSSLLVVPQDQIFITALEIIFTGINAVSSWE